MTSDDALDRLFSALSDTTRRRLLARLSLGPARVTDLAAPFEMSLPAISKHLRILEEAGLVSRNIDGRVHRIGLSAGPLRNVEIYLDPFRTFWEETWRRLDADLAEHPRPRRARGPRARPR